MTKALEYMTICLAYNISVTFSPMGMRLSKVNPETLEMYNREFDYEFIESGRKIDFRDLCQMIKKEAEREWKRS